MGYCYYLYGLDKVESDIYIRLLNGIKNFKKSIPLSGEISYDRKYDIFRMVKLDNPELFFCKSISLRGVGGAITAEPEYTFDKNNAEKLLSSFEKKADNIFREIINASTLEKEMFIHDYFLENVTYTALYKNYSHEIYGVFANKIGVCEGIAKTVKFVFDRCGIDSVIALGKPNIKNIAHAWNVVYIDGKTYHLDVTFDISSRGNKYRYFNLSDREIFADHEEPVFPLPKCE